MRGWRHPVRLVPLAFAVLILVGTLALLMPLSRQGGSDGSLLAAAFTATGAACGALASVDTVTYWTPFGQGVILVLIQLGGLGVMTLATLISRLVFGSVGLRDKLLAGAEVRTNALGDVRGLLRTVVISVVGIELAAASVLTARFYSVYDHGDLGQALWHGVFHGVSAFNHAGYALYSDNLMGFTADPWILGTMAAAIVAGGLGFPVYYELVRRWRRPATWSVHARLTIAGYAGLLVISTVGFGFLEWTNPRTLGSLPFGDKVLTTVFSGVTPSTAGFNAVDYGQARPETLALDSIAMFIGGGSAGTAGGIKVGTFLVLAFVLWAEIRGEPQVVVGHRAISTQTQRQAVTVALLGVGTVVGGAMVLLLVSDASLDAVIFEVTSAFGTSGLSTGITGSLPPVAQWTLMALMYVGRVGVTTAAAGLALRQRHRSYLLPEERPIVG